ncbi:MAG: UbiX family flavin prenyltransferase [Clostridia bacterium]|nr:UbiX family flavin prenyltransferase [Clostridia bacterium]
MRLIVGISGATGPIYGIRLLEVLRASGVETHLVVSEHAWQNIALESDYAMEDVKALADYLYDPRDVGAAPASGSFLCAGMVVAPCSIKTLSGIAHSYNENLLVRAADVTLKEGRKLVLVVRETPLHRGHLKLMLAAAEAGAVILPPMPAFYHRPRSIEELVDQTVGKVLDQFGIPHHLFTRWAGARPVDAPAPLVGAVRP